MKDILEATVKINKFNEYCVDCMKSKSTHCNITFGTLICLECAKWHWTHFTMNEHYIKPIFTEMWDSH